MSTLHYSAVTSVIVQVADSVTESSSGKFIMDTPQTSGTGPLLVGQWQTDLVQATLCPRPCSPLLFTPLLTAPCSLLLLGSSNWPCTLIVFSIQTRQIGRMCRTSLISLSFNAVSRCKTVTLLPFDPWLFYWAPFIKRLQSERLKSQYFFVLCICTTAYLMLLHGTRLSIKEQHNKTMLI